MSVRRREDFEMVYVPLENENLDVEYIPTFDFKETWTYKYMVYSFQFVERDIRQYSSHRSFRLFKLCRLISNLLMVAALCFDFMLFVQIFKEESDDLSFLSKIVTALVMTLWMTRHSVLYTSGTYLFAKHPNAIREISAKLQYSKEASYEESKEMKKKLKEIDEKMNKLISVTLFLLVLIPLLVEFSPFIVEMIINQKYKWRSWQLELGEMFVILYTRIASMPFFFYLIYCGLLQRYQVQEYCKAIKNPDYKGTLDDAFQGYVEIHQSISDHSENNKLYLKVFFSVIVTWGTLYAYFAVGMLRSLVKIDTKEVFYVFAAYDFFTQLLKYVLEVAILFSTLYYRLLRVEEELEETQSRILEVRCSTLPDDHCLKRMADSMDLVRHIRKYQKHDEPGYQVFHGRLSRIKMIWLILLSPLILYLANSVIEGKLRESA